MPRIPLLLLVALIAIVSAGMAWASPVYAPGWSATHADSANSDYSPVEAAADLAPVWQRDFSGAMTLGATSDSFGRIYLTTAASECHLYVLDAASGRTVWCSDKVGRLAVISAPLIDKDGRIFVADDQAMHAFDRDGKLLWRHAIEGVPLSAQFTPGGRVVFITNIGRLYVVDRDTGEDAATPIALVPGLAYNRAAGVLACARGEAACPCANTPAIDVASGRLFFTFWVPGAKQASVIAMQIVETGGVAVRPLWASEVLASGSGSSPTLSADGKRLYVTDNWGSMLALNAVTGAVVWSFPLGYQAGGSVSVSPDGIVMPAGGGKAAVMALSDDGVLKWRRGDLVNRGIATQTAGHHAYVTVERGRFRNDLVVIDTRSGREISRNTLSGTTIFSVGTTVGSDARVYVSTISGTLFAFRSAAWR